jgi:mevalonate kinase
MTASDSAARLACSFVRVPGKVIVSGEHAVVYGTPALACAIQKYAFAKITSTDVSGVYFKVPEFGIDQHFSHLQLSQLAQKTKLRHQQFLNGTGLLSNVVANPAHFFAAAIGASGLVDVLSNPHGLKIELSMDLVAGGGMGSSAALVAAMLAAAFKHLGRPLTAAQLIAKTTQSEHWQHGRSSGIDPYVCVMGGLQSFQKGTGERQVLNQLRSCFLVTTGKPDSSTGECVEAVNQQNFPPSLWRQFASVQENLLQCMLSNTLASGASSSLGSEGDNETHMVNAIAANHRLLQRLGVVPNRVAAFIANIETRGGGAKICGAGSIVGDQAGLVLVVGLAHMDVQEICLNYGYGVEEMLPDLDGVFYCD